MKKTNKFEVTVKATTGTCNSDLFKEMCKNGDVTSISITELVNGVITPQGDAICHIVTDERELDRTYIDTLEYGIVHTSSDVFLSGYETYKDKCDSMRIVAVKAKLGTCYKCVPVLNRSTSNEIEE